MPVNTVHNLLDFHIIPYELSRQAEETLSRHGGYSTLPVSQPPGSERPEQVSLMQDFSVLIRWNLNLEDWIRMSEVVIKNHKEKS